MPLRELWTADGPVPAQRVRWLDQATIRQLMRDGLRTLVAADAGGPLEWKRGDAALACWNAVKGNIADPDAPMYLDAFPDEYCFLASEWRTPDGEVIVLLEMHH